MVDALNPRATSSDYNASAAYWALVNAVLGGPDTLRAVGRTSVPGPHLAVPLLSQLNRGRGGPESPYLLKFSEEPGGDYDRRRMTAPLTNIYGDISRNLSSKPFAKTLELDEETSDDLKELAWNIDGLGNNLHVFSGDVFKCSLDKGITWILVDFPNVPQALTLADERAIGARPYWVHIPAERLLAIYSKFVNGQEVIFHARIDEPCVELDGYKEETYQRVRELNRAPVYGDNGSIRGFEPATWTVWELQEDEKTAAQTWVVKESGAIGVGFIPLVPVILGKRHGTSWRVEPPLRDLAHLQIEEFNQESNLKHCREMTAFSMLTGNGIAGTGDDGQVLEVPTGPNAVLFAPPNADGSHGEWKLLEPSATSLSFLQSDLEKLRTEMRDLGFQPLATQNITIVTSKNVSLKANSAVQAWALALKDALEQTWKITCQWLSRDEEPGINVHIDFSVEIEAGSELESLAKAEAAGVISKRLYFNELKRRRVIGDDADWDDDQEEMAEQQVGLEPEQPMDPLTGKPLAAPGPNKRFIEDGDGLTLQ